MMWTEISFPHLSFCKNTKGTMLGNGMVPFVILGAG